MAKYLLFAVLGGVISFILFRSLYLRNKAVYLRATLVLAASALAVPAVLFSSNYLLKLPYEVWFINFHSLPGAEALSGLVGALLGVMFASAKLRPNPLNNSILMISTVIAVMLLIAPFGKQILYRPDYSKLENVWKNDVCCQTSSFTCVPASCATVIKILGGNVMEKDLAVEAGTNMRGTEIWYMMRALRKFGYKIEARAAKSLEEIPAPCVLGVKVGNIGHVVAVMSKNDDGIEIGEPLSGMRKHYTWQALGKRYHPSLIYYVVKPVTTH
jgi:hypothetical protein